MMKILFKTTAVLFLQRISLFLFFLFLSQISFGQGDPDVPDFARYKINKEEFMKQRSEAIGKLRGIIKDQPFDPTKRSAAIKQMEIQEEQLRSSRNSLIGDPWVPIGPAPIPNGQVATGPSTAVSGRVTAIAVHPTNANIVYVGTAQGGVYRTTNGGTNWTPLMDNAQSLAIGSIAIAPSSPETVYVGTGEPNFSADSYFGVGVYRITNASTTANLSGPFNQDAGAADIFSGRAIGEIIVHPTNADIIFVASTSGIGGLRPANSALPSRGIYRCVNATSGSPVFSKLTGLIGNLNVSVRDIEIDPLNPNILIAIPIATGVNQGGIYRSANALDPVPGNVTFTQQFVLNSTSTSTLNGELTVIHPAADPDATFYAAMGNSNGQVYRSTDGGVTWTLRVDNNFCGGQCFYDIAIAVDPTDVNTVYLGGDPTIVAAKSTNGGTTFTDNKSGVHVDTHAFTVSPSDPTQVWLGTDGGIYKSTNSGINWTPLNNTQFSATQFMSIDVHPTDPNFSLGGTQDNGTNWYQPAATWIRADFGDGGYAVIDQNATDNVNVRMYHTYFNAVNLQGYGTVATTASASDGLWAFRGCQTTGATVNGITCNGAINFYAPLERGPGNPNTIYYGSDRLYRSANNGTNHTVVSQNPIVSGVPLSSIGISPQDDNVRIVGLNNGDIYGTSTGANPLLNLDPSNTIPNVAIARTIVDPNTATTAYVTLSAFGVNSVWKTTNLGDAGTTWASASSGLPQIPVNAIVVDPANSNNVYVGTDIGVYGSTDGGATWLPYGTGLPRVAVFGMAITALPNKKLRIATHGRGMWQNSLVAAAPTVTINQAVGQADPTSGSPINFTVVFSEPVTGFATGDVTLTGTAGATTGVVTGSGATYNVAVSGMTGSGTVIASIMANVATGTVNVLGNEASTSTDNTVTFNVPAAGSIIVTEIMQNPNAVTDANGEWFEIYNTTGSAIDINGWTIRDLGTDNHVINNGGPLMVAPGGYLVLGNNANSGTNGGVTVNYAYPSTWFLGNADDEVILEIAGTVIDQVNYDGGPLFPDPTGASMNLEPTQFNSTANDNGANWCTSTTPYGSGDLGTPGAANISCIVVVAPTVTINQAVGQVDPTSTSPINFTVVFSEAVTGFDNSDITLSGTAGATTAVVTGAGPTYNVAVSGMTGSGTVIASIPANAATGTVNVTGNAASTSTDNTVTYNVPVVAPTVTINQAVGQVDPTSTSPINFTVVFSEAVTGFDNSDITLSGTAGATTAVVTGAGPTYNVAVSGMTGSGTVIASIPANAATGTVNVTGNAASTSTDNTVTFNLPPANDLCTNAIPISCGGTASGSTVFANIDGPGVDCGGGSVAADVWYVITGTGNNITASLCGPGTNYDSQIDIYTGTCGSLISLTCDDDFCSFAGPSEVTWSSVSGTTYYIRVHGFGGATGSYSLSIINCCLTPTVDPVTSQTLCNNTATTAINFTGTPPGVTFSWSNDNTSIGLAANGTGNIGSFTATNATNAPVTATITVTPQLAGCPDGTPIMFTITVNPTPNVVATPSGQTVCSGTPITTIVLSGAVAGTVYNWTRDNTVNVTGIATPGSGNISGTLTNTTNVAQTTTFTITPMANGCPGAPITATVTVNPTPTVSPVPPNQTVCNGAPTAPINFTGPVAGTTFNWMNNTPSIGLAASGTGNIASFNATNTSNVPVTATITVTPVTTPSATINFNHTGSVQTWVVPAGVTSVNIQAFGAQGNANAAGVSRGGLGGSAAGTLAVTPGETLWINVGGGGITSITGGFNGGGNAGTTGACATAPGGGGGGASDVRKTANTLANRAIVAGGGGGTAGNRVATCSRGAGGGGGGGYFGGGGGSGYPGIAGVVPTGGTQAAGGAGGITATTFGATNGLPGVLGIGGSGGNEAPSNQAASLAVIFGSGNGGGLTGNSGQQSGLNNFTGQSGAGGSSYIGGVTGGTTTAGVQTGNGLVTISYTTVGPTCTGPSSTFTITVNPTPNAVAAPTTQTICSGTAMTPIVLSGNVSGTVYNWVRNNTTNVTGIANSGSGNISGTPINNTTVQQTVTYTITPIANGCPGTPITATLIVNKEPTISCPANITVNNAPGVCGANVTYPAATATGSPAPAITYSHASGSFFPVGTTTVTATATNTCGVATCTFTITVVDNEAPTVTCPGNITQNTDPGMCIATVAVPNPTTADNCAVTQVTWVMTGATTGSSPATGINFVGTRAFNLNGTTGQGVTTIMYTVKDAAGNTSTCSFTVTVNDRQLPLINTQPANQTVCTGANATFSVTAVTSPVAGGPLSYQWQMWNGSTWNNIAGATASTYTVNSTTVAMNTNSFRVIITGLCTVRTSTHASLYVNPLPTINLTTSIPPNLLPTQVLTITATTAPSGGSYVWFKNGVIIPGASGNTLGGLTVSDIGTYRVVYTDPNGCVVTSSNVEITGAPSDGLYVYPVPNNGQFIVRFYNATNEQVTLRVIDAKGAEVYRRKVQTTIPYTTINVDLITGRIFASGVYVVEMRKADGTLAGARRIIVYK